MTDTERFNDIYLNLEIRKSQGKTDEFGNYIFEVEASNENLDLQNQIVLQNALLESKDEFLKGGVISYDHLHKRKGKDGEVISDPSMVIGEPIEVKTQGKSTIVVGKLYSTNEKAKELIKMLKAGSTRVRASVGGIFPEVIRNVKTGVEKITHVLWNDLALTTSPVNNTVGSAVFAKSMNPDEFVKALAAGYETDSNAMQGGRALIPEDTNTKTMSIENEEENGEKEIIRSLCLCLQTGEVTTESAAVDYLTNRGIDKNKSRDIVREIINQGGQMMKKSFSNSVSTLFKSLTGGNQKDDEDEIKDDEDLGFDEDEIEIDDEAESGDDDGEDMDNDDIEDEDDGEEDNETKKSNCDDDEDGDAVDGTEVLKSLDYELKTMRKSIRQTRAQLNDLITGMGDMAQMIYAIGSEKLPPKSVLNKSMPGNAGKTMQKSTVPTNARPTEEDLNRVQDCLIRCVREGKIDMVKSSLISSDMQKCMYSGKPMKAEYYEFLQRELAQEAK